MAKLGDEVQQATWRPPGFPVVPFLFPMGIFLGLLGLSVWFNYQTWKKLDAISRKEMGRPAGL